ALGHDRSVVTGDRLQRAHHMRNVATAAVRRRNRGEPSVRKAYAAASAAINAAAAPATSPARGPALSASQPISGAPIGVEPRKTIEYSAIARARMTGSTAICSEEFTPAAKVTDAAPKGTRARTCNGRVGATAASSIATPNSVEATISSRGVTRPRAP